MQSQILTDLDRQNEADELAIDYPKIDKLKFYSTLIFQLFKTSIEYGDNVPASSKSSTKDRKQWISLFGEKNDRQKAKKYIASLVNPEYTQTIRKNQILEKIINRKNFLNEFIKEYQVNFENLNNDEISIQGKLEDVTSVKCTIDLEVHRLKIMQEQSSKSEDDEIIWISDPYEAFDEESLKTKPKLGNRHKKTPLETSFEQLNIVTKKPNLNLTNPIQMHKNLLKSHAQEQGFDLKVIESALKEPKTANLGTKEFIEYLKATSQLENYETKKSLLNDSDCEIIQYFPKKTSNLQVEKDKTNTFNEYAQMVETQRFDQENEKINKVKRISKLISAMPEDQKISALSQVTKYNSKNNSKSKQTEKQKNAIETDQGTLNNAKKSNKNQEYNPQVYQDNENNSGQNTDSNFEYLFSMQNELSKKNSNSNLNKFSNAIKAKKKNNRNQSLDKNFDRNLNRNRSKSAKVRYKSNDRQVAQVQNKQIDSSNLRYIIIDGSNVAREHGKQYGKVFSSKGIKIVVDYFVKRGHTQIKAIIPRFRRGNSDTDCPTLNPELLDELENDQYLSYTPSRYVNNKLILPYDDRFIISAATHYDAIIVSNDNYRDLMNEDPEWKRVIQRNLLQYTFIGDLFMIAQDPMGRNGPSLDEFLSVNYQKEENSNKNKNNIRKNQSSSVINPNVNSQTNYSKNSYGFIALEDRNDYQNKPNSLMAQEAIGNSKPNKINNALQITNKKENFYSVLIEMFPSSDRLIKQLLDLYRMENDINFFVSRLVNNS